MDATNTDDTYAGIPVRNRGLFQCADWQRMAENLMAFQDAVQEALGTEEAGDVLGAIRRLKRPSPTLLDLIERFGIDPAPCGFDLNGGCQAHGYLSLEPGEKCPQREAKDLLAEYGRRQTEGDQPR
jgi:hypothetical protein